MHLKAIAVLLGLLDLGGKFTTRHPGAKFGHFVGDVEAKSGYSRSC